MKDKEHQNFVFGHLVWTKSIMSGQTLILVGNCPMSDCYFKHCTIAIEILKRQNFHWLRFKNVSTIKFQGWGTYYIIV